MKFVKLPKKFHIIYHGRFRNKVVEWYFGNICNLDCSYCLNAYTRNDYYRNMTFEETKKTVEFINTLKGVYQTIFIGGEPSCFEHCLYAVEHIQDCRVNLMTNGMNEKFIQDAVQFATQDKPMLICCSMHYEYYMQDKQRYMNHLHNLIDICKDNPFVELEFLMLLDKDMTQQYKELIEWIIRNAKGFNKNFGYSVSYVRRDNSIEEAVKNYVSMSILDADVRDVVREDLKEDRMSFIKENPHYHKQCPCFKNYINIRLDGRLKHADCAHPIYSKKSIFDDDFNLEKEQHYIECCEKHTENNGTCRNVLGKFKW